MKYLVSQVEKWGDDLDALRAPDPGSRKVGKREAVLLLSKKLQGAAKRGFTTAELLEALAAKGLRVHVDLLREALRTAGKVSAATPVRGRRRAGASTGGAAEERRTEGEGSGGDPIRQALEPPAGNGTVGAAQLSGTSTQAVTRSGPGKREGAVATEALNAGSGAGQVEEAGSGPRRMPASAPVAARQEMPGRTAEGSREQPEGAPAPAWEGDGREDGDGRSAGAAAGRATVARGSGDASGGGTVGKGSFTPRSDSERI